MFGDEIVGRICVDEYGGRRKRGERGMEVGGTSAEGLSGREKVEDAGGIGGRWGKMEEGGG